MKLEKHLKVDIGITVAVSVIASSRAVWMRADTNRLERDVPMGA